VGGDPREEGTGKSGQWELQQRKRKTEDKQQSWANSGLSASSKIIV